MAKKQTKLSPYNYKALMIDVDGTLISNFLEAVPSKRVIDAINKASAKVHIGLATSRPYFMLKHILPLLQLKGPSVINAGSQIIDTETKKIIWEQGIRRSDILLIRNVLLNLDVIAYVNENETDYQLDNNYIAKNPLQVHIPGLAPKIADQVIDEVSAINDIVAHKVPSFTNGRTGIIITHTLATKQHGIYEVAKILKLKTKDFIGIGDGDNDFPLLMACGLKVAMGNAVESLKAIADYIAPPVEKDGLAQVIEKFVLNKEL